MIVYIIKAVKYDADDALTAATSIEKSALSAARLACRGE